MCLNAINNICYFGECLVMLSFNTSSIDLTGISFIDF